MLGALKVYYKDRNEDYNRRPELSFSRGFLSGKKRSTR
jgi:hypothetical protein